MNRAERTALLAEAVEKQNEQVKKDGKPLRAERLWCKDDWRNFPVYKVPADALLLNIDNRRFTAERKLIEEQLGHSLDPENNPNDEFSVISILLDTGHTVDGDVAKGVTSKAAVALKADWKKRKQETPFWIRPDGTVRNGNRRLAMLKRMRTEDGIDGTKYVDAIILDPDDVDEQELFEMEQREQLTENFKVRYTDINLLITLREAAIAREIDWTSSADIERVAGELQDLVEGDKSYAQIQLGAIKYMDAYLSELEAPGEYHKLIGTIERFRDVGKTMAKLEDQPEEAAEMLRMLFAGITGGVRHGDIRAIGKIFREDRDEYRRIKETVFRLEEEGDGSSKLESPKLDEVTADATDDDNDTDELAPVVASYPSRRVKSAILDGIDGFNSKQLEVSRKLAQAASRLRPINNEHLSEALKGSDATDVREALKEIVGWATKAKTVL